MVVTGFSLLLPDLSAFLKHTYAGLSDAGVFWCPIKKVVSMPYRGRCGELGCDIGFMRLTHPQGPIIERCLGFIFTNLSDAGDV